MVMTCKVTWVVTGVTLVMGNLSLSQNELCLLNCLELSINSNFCDRVCD